MCGVRDAMLLYVATVDGQRVPVSGCVYCLRAYGASFQPAGSLASA